MKKPRVFYGYWIVLATFLCVAITQGCSFFTFSLFVKPLQADLGWSRGGIMAAFTILYLVQGAASPFIGRVVDQYGARMVITFGALVSGLGFLFLNLMDNLWQFYAGYIAVGIGMAAASYVPATAVVSNWFKKRRGLTLGIMQTGIGAGALVLAPLVGGYIIPNLGWRASFLFLALLTWVVIIPLALLVIKTKPTEMGLYPDAAETPKKIATSGASHPTPEGITLKMSLSTTAFWLAIATFLANGFSQVGVVQTQTPHLEDIGFPVAAAATALGGVGLGSALGKLIFGWLCDRIPAKYAWAIGLSLQLVSIMILMSVGPESHLSVIWLYSILMGLGAGSWLPTMSMLTVGNFGLVSFGAIFGALTFAHSTGVALGPLLAGYMYDVMGTYHWAFIIFAASYAISIPSILLIRRPKSV